MSTGSKHIHAGQKFEWRGLPGQYNPGAHIRIDSTTANMQVNAAVLRKGQAPHLVTIGAADLMVAVEQGWLVPVPVSGVPVDG